MRIVAVIDVRATMLELEEIHFLHRFSSLISKLLLFSARPLLLVIITTINSFSHFIREETPRKKKLRFICFSHVHSYFDFNKQQKPTKNQISSKKKNDFSCRKWISYRKRWQYCHRIDSIYTCASIVDWSNDSILQFCIFEFVINFGRINCGCNACRDLDLEMMLNFVEINWSQLTTENDVTHLIECNLLCHLRIPYAI